jgi:two-component system, cell cycle response regulator CtrA
VRILHIEDDASVALALQLTLEAAGFTVTHIDNGEDGIEEAREAYDVIITDIGLPDVSGFDVIKRIRALNIKTPIIVLTGGAHTPEEKARGLNLGADDYMTKPAHKDELVARVHAVVRRSNGHHHAVLTSGNLTVNPRTMSITVNGIGMSLPKRKYKVLELLILRKGEVLSRDTFLNHLYHNHADEPQERVVDAYIGQIRRKLIELGLSGTNIHTVHGFGYRLSE